MSIPHLNRPLIQGTDATFFKDKKLYAHLCHLLFCSLCHDQYKDAFSICLFAPIQYSTDKETEIDCSVRLFFAKIWTGTSVFVKHYSCRVLNNFVSHFLSLGLHGQISIKSCIPLRCVTQQKRPRPPVFSMLEEDSTVSA